MKDPNRRRGPRLGNGYLLGGVGSLEEPWKDKHSSSPRTPSGATTSAVQGRTCGRSRSFWRAVSLILALGAASFLTFAAFQLFGVSFRPMVVPTWQQQSALHAVSTASEFTAATLATSTGLDPWFPSSSSSSLSNNHHRRRRHALHVRHAVEFPDQLVLIVNRPPQSSLTSPLSSTTTAVLRCLYFGPDSASPTHDLPPLAADPVTPRDLAVRCPLPQQGLHVSLGGGSSDGVRHYSSPIVERPHRWDSLAYASLLDREENSTIVFVKGLNLRPDKLFDTARYQCVFGWQFRKPKYLLTSEAVSVAQEVVRCKTPLAVLRRSLAASQTGAGPLSAGGGENLIRPALHDGVLVSIHVRGRGGFLLPSVATPVPVDPPPAHPRKHVMCACTMVRNQARFVKEWVMYHARFGVQRFFIYDNNSNDSLAETVQSMDADNYNVTRHPWPWIKTQEAGFAHCALRAREHCDWVGFFDVDEFLYIPTSSHHPHSETLHDFLANYTTNYPAIGELRTTCFSFGPSGRKTIPVEGVTVGYTCRMITPERHKSIVRPEALSTSLVNVVHHFHLRDGYEYVNVDRSAMVINHYKYQVWEVFKEKFYRRVATYVADWQDDENVGSKDRAPGLGTKAVEPADWSSRFCEVSDTGLKNWVVRQFADPNTGILPWS